MDPESITKTDDATNVAQFDAEQRSALEKAGLNPEVALKAAEAMVATVTQKVADSNAQAMQDLTDKVGNVEKHLENDKRFASNEDRIEKEAQEVVVKQIFAVCQKDTPQIASLQDQLVKNGHISELQVKSQNTTTPSDGGCLVHPLFGRDILRCIEKNIGLETLCQRVAFNGKEWYGNQLISDVQVEWVEECGPLTESQLGFGKVKITISKLGGFTIICNELFDFQMDTPDIYRLLVERYALAFTRKIDEMILYGDGTAAYGSNFGITYATALNGFTVANGYASGPINEVVVAAGTQTPDGISVDDIIDMIICPDDCWDNGDSRFVMHRKMLAIIAKMKDANGLPLLQATFNVKMTNLLGYPVTLNNAMNVPTLTAADADKVFIVFGNFKNYLIAYKKAIRIKTSEHATMIDKLGNLVRSFYEDKTIFRALRYIGGGPLVPGAFSVFKTAP